MVDLFLGFFFTLLILRIKYITNDTAAMKLKDAYSLEGKL